MGGDKTCGCRTSQSHFGVAWKMTVCSMIRAQGSRKKTRQLQHTSLFRSGSDAVDLGSSRAQTEISGYSLDVDLNLCKNV